MRLLSVNTKEGRTQNMVSGCVHIPSNSFQLSFLQSVAISSIHFSFSFPDLKLLIYNDIKIILPSFHWSSWQFQTISVHFHVFYAVPHGRVRKIISNARCTDFKNKH